MMNATIKNNSKYPIITFLIILISLVVLVGSQAGVRVDNNSDENSPNDQHISYFIETEFIVQDGVTQNNIDVETKDGIVTLSGNVDNLLAKDRAIHISKAVKGVRAVVDKLHIVNVDLSDSVLKHNVEMALLLDPAADSYEINVQVINGDIILSGVVDSWQEKMLSDKVVRSVKGVKSVENNIYFKYTSDRTDHEIKQDIVQALNWDIRVNDGLIDVDVNDGHVALTGIVGSASEQSQATVDAWVAGVKEVETSDLVISSWTREEELRKNKYASKSDVQIKEAVKDAFLYDPRVLSFNPEVNVENGIVTLKGYVDNLKAKKAAERDARNVVGVWKVNNLLKVRLDIFPSDPEIESNVKAALRLNPFVEGYEITVLSTAGKVTLLGTVDNYQEKFEAEEIASGIYGVIEVKNKLITDITATPYAFDYLHQYYYPFGYHAEYRNLPVKTDIEIKNDIENQLWWSPYVNSSDVSVIVDDGVAVLEGTVESWNEYRYAEKNAYDGGARRVDNELEVDFIE